jgi:catechol 2,3-dioxygenase-like lactoylglutathione lyase family enzyme
MTQLAAPRPFDHLVLAVRDLDAAAQFYRRLGFQVGARNRHPWGTENHIVQLDGTFLELISTGESFDSASGGPFAHGLSRYLSQREGLAMLVLRSQDAAADAQAFLAAGVGAGRLDFGRKGLDAHGRPTEVAFALAFARSPLIDDAEFFVCEQKFPQNFWSKAAQVHPNGARRLAAVAMIAEGPSDHAEFLSHFTRQREMLATSLGLELALGQGERLEVLTPVAFAFRYGANAAAPQARLAGFRVAVADLEAVRAALVEAAIPFDAQGQALVVPASAAYGVAIGFQSEMS